MSSVTNCCSRARAFGADSSPNRSRLGSPLPLGEAAEHLVVGAVLLDHVDHVLDRRRVARMQRDDGRLRGARDADLVTLVEAVVGDDLIGVCLKLVGRVRVRHGDLGQRALDHGGDVLVRPASIRRSVRVGSAGVGAGPQALGVEDVQLLAVVGQEQGGRVPGRRDQALDLVVALLGTQGDDRHVVVRGVGDVEGLAVRGHGQGVGAAALPGAGVRRQVDGPHDHVLGGVDDRDDVAVRVGDVQLIADGVQGHRVGVRADLDAVALGEEGLGQIHHGDRLATLVADVGRLAVPRQGHGVGVWRRPGWSSPPRPSSPRPRSGRSPTGRCPGCRRRRACCHRPRGPGPP